jgi:hypothetical protein
VTIRHGWGRLRAVGLLGVLGLSLGACAGLLPRHTEITTSPFKNFADANAAYQGVVVGQTTAANLEALGYNSSRVLNIRQLTYLDVLTTFLPRDGIPFNTMPPAVQSCVAALTKCVGYEISPSEVHRNRSGNAFLDFFGFKRKTHTTGWDATALFVLNDGIVVYKVWSGDPRIDKSEVQVNPLGPVQDLGSAFNRAVVIR